MSMDEYINFDLEPSIFDDIYIDILKKQERKIGKVIKEYNPEEHNVYLKTSIVLSISSFILLLIGMFVWAGEYSFREHWISDVGLTKVDGELNQTSFILFSLALSICAFQQIYIAFLSLSVAKREPMFVSLTISMLFTAICFILLIVYPLNIDSFKHGVCALGIYIGIFTSTLILFSTVANTDNEVFNKKPVFWYCGFMIIVFVFFIIFKITHFEAQILQKIYMFSTLAFMSIYISTLRYFTPPKSSKKKNKKNKKEKPQYPIQ